MTPIQRMRCSSREIGTNTIDVYSLGIGLLTERQMMGWKKKPSKCKGFYCRFHETILNFGEQSDP